MSSVKDIRLIHKRDCEPVTYISSRNIVPVILLCFSVVRSGVMQSGGAERVQSVTPLPLISARVRACCEPYVILKNNYVARPHA